MMMQFGKTDLGHEVTGNIVIHPLNFILFKNCYLNKSFSDNLRSLSQNTHLLRSTISPPGGHIFFSYRCSTESISVYINNLLQSLEKITFLHTNKCLAKMSQIIHLLSLNFWKPTFPFMKIQTPSINKSRTKQKRIFFNVFTLCTVIMN